MDGMEDSHWSRSPKFMPWNRFFRGERCRTVSRTGTGARTRTLRRPKRLCVSDDSVSVVTTTSSLSAHSSSSSLVLLMGTGTSTGTSSCSCSCSGSDSPVQSRDSWETRREDWLRTKLSEDTLREVWSFLDDRSLLVLASCAQWHRVQLLGNSCADDSERGVWKQRFQSRYSRKSLRESLSFPSLPPTDRESRAHGDSDIDIDVNVDPWYVEYARRRTMDLTVLPRLQSIVSARSTPTSATTTTTTKKSTMKSTTPTRGNDNHKYDAWSSLLMDGSEVYDEVLRLARRRWNRDDVDMDVNVNVDMEVTVLARELVVGIHRFETYRALQEVFYRARISPHDTLLLEDGALLIASLYRTGTDLLSATEAEHDVIANSKQVLDDLVTRLVPTRQPHHQQQQSHQQQEQHHHHQQQQQQCDSVKSLLEATQCLFHVNDNDNISDNGPNPWTNPSNTTTDYSNCDHSLLPKVLEHRRGTPLTLSVITASIVFRATGRSMKFSLEYEHEHEHSSSISSSITISDLWKRILCDLIHRHRMAIQTSELDGDLFLTTLKYFQRRMDLLHLLLDHNNNNTSNNNNNNKNDEWFLRMPLRELANRKELSPSMCTYGFWSTDTKTFEHYCY